MVPLLAASRRRRARIAPNAVTSATLVAWGDATQLPVVADATPLASWTDQSGLGHHAVQATGSLQPLYKTAIQNGLPVVRFDGVDDFLRVAFALNQPVWAMIVAAYRVSGGTNPTLVDGGAAGNTGRIYYDGVGTITLNAGSNLGRVFNAVTWAVYTILVNGASSQINVNGGIAPTNGAAGAGNPGGFTLGATGGGLQPGTVDIAEYAYYSAAPSAADQMALVAYARARWGI